MSTMTMQRPAHTGGDFEPCPEGQHPSVLADICDEGWKEVVYEGKSQGLKPFIKLVWQCHVEDEETGEEKTYLVFDKPMKLSFDPKSTLYKRLSDWLTNPKLEEMLDNNGDFGSLLGKPALLSVTHREYNGNFYANVGAIMPLPRKMAAPEVTDYTRRCERDDWEEKKPQYSAFQMLPAGANTATQNDAPPSNGNYARAQAATPKPQSAAPSREVDPRADNTGRAAQKAKTAELASGFDPTGDDDQADPFEDE